MKTFWTLEMGASIRREDVVRGVVLEIKTTNIVRDTHHVHTYIKTVHQYKK
mgnify:CR=1 FL=1